jgi:hypothetical protein
MNTLSDVPLFCIFGMLSTDTLQYIATTSKLFNWVVTLVMKSRSSVHLAPRSVTAGVPLSSRPYLKPCLTSYLTALHTRMATPKHPDTVVTDLVLNLNPPRHGNGRDPSDDSLACLRVIAAEAMVVFTGIIKLKIVSDRTKRIFGFALISKRTFDTVDITTGGLDHDDDREFGLFLLRRSVRAKCLIYRYRSTDIQNRYLIPASPYNTPVESITVDIDTVSVNQFVVTESWADFMRWHYIRPNIPDSYASDLTIITTLECGSTLRTVLDAIDRRTESSTVSLRVRRRNDTARSLVGRDTIDNTIWNMTMLNNFIAAKFDRLDLSSAIGLTGTQLRDFADRHWKTLTSLSLRNVGIPVSVIVDGIHPLNNASTKFVIADSSTADESDVAYLCSVCVNLTNLDVGLGEADDIVYGMSLQCYEHDTDPRTPMEVARAMFTRPLATKATVNYTGRKFKK